MHTFAKYLSVKNSFLKKIIAIVILISLFSHLLGSIGLTAWYELNRDYITSRHCENKDKPQLKCNGKCYLKKQLKKLNQNGDAPSRSSNNKADGEHYPVFVVPDFIALNHTNSVRVVVYFGKAGSRYGFLHERLVYHPPKPKMGSACM